MDNNFDSLLKVSAVPQDDKKAAFVAESRNNRNRCYELSEQTTIAIATSADAFQKYLDVQSRFDRYTANNAILIMAQRPDATKLGDYGYWLDKGAFIKKMEKNNPVLIMEPGKEYVREDGSIGTYYNAKKLYDISQTDKGAKIQREEEISEKDIIRALVSNPPVDIIAADADKMPEDKGAIFEPGDKCIYVRKGMDAENIFRSIAPELALAEFAAGRKDYNRDEGAFHAYCVSYMLCKKYGFDTQSYDFSHAPEMFEGLEPQEIRSELSISRDAANKILSRMAKSLEQDRQQSLRQQDNPEQQQGTQQGQQNTPPQYAGNNFGQRSSRGEAR